MDASAHKDHSMHMGSTTFTNKARRFCGREPDHHLQINGLATPSIREQKREKKEMVEKSRYTVRLKEYKVLQRQKIEADPKIFRYKMRRHIRSPTTSAALIQHKAVFVTKRTR